MNQLDYRTKLVRSQTASLRTETHNSVTYNIRSWSLWFVGISTELLYGATSSHKQGTGFFLPGSNPGRCTTLTAIFLIHDRYLPQNRRQSSVPIPSLSLRIRASNLCPTSETLRCEQNWESVCLRWFRIRIKFLPEHLDCGNRIEHHSLDHQAT